MKEKIFFGALFFGNILSINAQSSCYEALELQIGITAVDAITGSYQYNCFDADTADAANWYKYTATENGAIRINSNLNVNDGETYSDDTRVSVYTGTCNNLVCWTFSDDLDFDSGEYLVDFEVQVISGQTYYIAFDNNWNSLGFQLEVSFTPFSCFPVTGGFTISQNSSLSQVIASWTPAINFPVGYEVLWGETGFDPETDGIIIGNITDPQVTFSQLNSETTYDFYVKTLCGDNGNSTLVGPISFTTVQWSASVPYTYGFEAVDISGWTMFNVNPDGSPWSIDEDGTVPAHAGSYYARVGAYANPSDSWLFSRGIHLYQNETYTVSYYLLHAVLGGSGNTNNLKVTVGLDPNVESQTTILQSFENYSENVYVKQSYDFTPESTDVYYFGFNYTSPAHTGEDFGVLALDDFNIDVTAVSDLNQLQISKLAIFPNPTNGIVTITNSENILISDVNITDLNGRSLKTFKCKDAAMTEINITDLASGIYLMTISSDKGIATKKIIKN